MAVVLESVASTTWTSSTGVSITKPSGLAEGDLLLAYLGSFGGNVFSTPSGWTSLHSLTEAGQGRRLQVMYKVADATDVAASDFPFITGVSSEYAGVLMRISGGIVASIVSEQTAVTDDDSPAYTGITPANTDSLLVLGLITNATGNPPTVAGYAIATSNPTWTERADLGRNITALAVATASRPEGTATGNATVAITGSGESSDSAAVLFSIPPVVNATASPDVVVLASAVQEPSVSGAANVTADVVVLASAVQEPSVSAPTPTWVGESKSSTTWTPQSKN